MPIKIAFAGSDSRTLMSALVVSTATSEKNEEKYRGMVFRGSPAMKPLAELSGWPVDFLSTKDNSVDGYAEAMIEALKSKKVDYIVPLPEDLFYQGLIDKVSEAGFGEKISGLKREASFIEGDKIRAKEFCREAGVSVADEWTTVNAKDYPTVLKICLEYIHRHGGAVLKYPYTAGGKGSRVISDSWQIKKVYDGIVKEYGDNYQDLCGAESWPLLVESRMSGMEISFTALVDKKGNFQILPTAMDYPERFAGLPGPENPVTGGMGSISPHPVETREILEMAAGKIFRPLIGAMKKAGFLRPCILYPGCFVSLDEKGRPTAIRVCEVNIRPGEPEFQVVTRRIRNLGALFEAMFEGNLDKIRPEIRENQVAMTMALVTGPGGPKGQKGYPWSCTRKEVMEMDLASLKKKGITLVPSAMDFQEDKFFSDGSRVCYLTANAAVKDDQSRGKSASLLREKLLRAFDEGKVRVIPRENKSGNRLDLRRDIGSHYEIADDLFNY
jgi:phosphoribosylamine---glycine ligase